MAALATNARAALNFLGAQRPDLDEVRHCLGGIIKDAHRAGDILSRIRALVKKVPPRKDRLDMNEAILEIIALTRSEMMRNGVSLRTYLAKDLPSAYGDRASTATSHSQFDHQRRRGDEFREQ